MIDLIITQLKTLSPGILIAVILLMAFFLNAYWIDQKALSTKRNEALEANTAAIIKLQIQIEQLAYILTLIPKLKEDLHSAFEKIRNLEKQDPKI